MTVSVTCSVLGGSEILSPIQTRECVRPLFPQNYYISIESKQHSNICGAGHICVLCYNFDRT